MRDWTTGAPKWAAVVVLGGAGMLGLAWSAWTERKPAWVVGPSDGAAPTVSATDPAPPAGDRPRASDERPDTPRASDGEAIVIDVNTATAAELELLPGIGPTLARAIVEDRGRRGPFRSLEDLDRVPGIGAKTIEGLRGRARVSR